MELNILETFSNLPELDIGETITFDNFQDYCAQLAVNNNSGYRRQFQVIFLIINKIF